MGRYRESANSAVCKTVPFGGSGVGTHPAHHKDSYRNLFVLYWVPRVVGSSPTSLSYEGVAQLVERRHIAVLYLTPSSKWSGGRPLKPAMSGSNPTGATISVFKYLYIFRISNFLYVGGNTHMAPSSNWSGGEPFKLEIRVRAPVVSPLKLNLRSAQVPAPPRNTSSVAQVKKGFGKFLGKIDPEILTIFEIAYAGLAQLVRAHALQAWGRRFESVIPHQWARRE